MTTMDRFKQIESYLKFTVPNYYIAYDMPYYIIVFDINVKLKVECTIDKGSDIFVITLIKSNGIFL